jgi:hypothetical protein
LWWGWRRAAIRVDQMAARRGGMRGALKAGMTAGTTAAMKD